MGEITWEMRRTYGNTVNWLSPELLTRLDRDEILDRLDEAAALMKKIDTASAEQALGYAEQAHRICTAEPRDEVEKAAAGWLSKADAAYTPEHSAECVRQAHMIREANPSATRRPRTPTPEQVRHAEAVATLKADIAGQVKALMPDRTSRLDQLTADVADVTARVGVMTKTAAPVLAMVRRPDIAKAETARHR